jgi:hypothetical protein
VHFTRNSTQAGEGFFLAQGFGHLKISPSIKMKMQVVSVLVNLIP